MTNTTAPATAAAITNHDEWVAFYTAPRNISAFARTVISAKDIANGQSGDYHDAVHLAYQVKDIIRLEAMTDAELAAEEARCLAEDGWNEAEGKYEYYYVGAAEETLCQIYLLREFRADKAGEARWAIPAAGHLTHTPFAVLAAAGL